MLDASALLPRQAASAARLTQAIRDALGQWQENCEQGRREEAELEEYWEREDAEREEKRKAG